MAESPIDSASLFEQFCNPYASPGPDEIKPPYQSLESHEQTVAPVTQENKEDKELDTSWDVEIPINNSTYDSQQNISLSNHHSPGMSFPFDNSESLVNDIPKETSAYHDHSFQPAPTGQEPPLNIPAQDKYITATVFDKNTASIQTQLQTSSPTDTDNNILRESSTVPSAPVQPPVKNITEVESNLNNPPLQDQPHQPHLTEKKRPIPNISDIDFPIPDASFSRLPKTHITLPNPIIHTTSSNRNPDTLSPSQLQIQSNSRKLQLLRLSSWRRDYCIKLKNQYLRDRGRLSERQKLGMAKRIGLLRFATLRNLEGLVRMVREREKGGGCQGKVGDGEVE